MNLEKLTPEIFRQKLAGIESPIKKFQTSEASSIKAEAIRYITVLAHLFGESLDRLTLWERIGSAIATSYAKASNDFEIFVAKCLEHVKAEDGKVAACSALSDLLQTIGLREIEYQKSFVQYLHTRRLILLVHARERWEEVKAKRIEL